ncbi:EAL domain-containing protein [Saliniradius amylolyticus]|nr:EAL domain-containing protein [Saliniradius amylolyticus]
MLLGSMEYTRHHSELEQQRVQISKRLGHSMTQVNDQISQYLNIAQGVGAYWLMHPQLTQQEYGAFTHQLLQNSKVIRHIAASRNQVIEYVYPLKGNEQVIGLNIARLPEQRQALLKAQESHSTVIDGPIALVQGGQALIARHPVFSPDSGQFWGTVSLVLHYDTLLEQALAETRSELRLSIRVDNDAPHSAQIYGTAIPPEQSPITASLAVGDTSWQFSAVPRKGWQSYQPFVLLWLSGLLTVFIWWRLAYTHLLRHQLTDQHRADQYRQAKRFEQMFYQHSAIMLTIDADSGEILSANNSAEAFYGYSESELRSMNIARLNNLPEEEVSRRRKQALTGQVNCFVFPHRLANGDIRNVEIHSSPVHVDDKAILLSIIHDVTERVEQEQKLKLDAKVFDNSQEAIMITDADQCILAINPAFCRITGYHEEEAIGATPTLLNSGRHGPEFYREMYQSLDTYGHWRGEIWNRRKDGTVYPELLSISSVLANDGQVTHYVAVFSDITSQKQSEEKLEQLAHYDLLTGLPNRLLLKSRMQHAIESANRNQAHLAALFLDLDQFKYVNDSMGHASGDILLQEVAQVLSHRIRTSDTLARLGGDEFVVLLEDIHSPEDATTVAADLINALNRPFRLNEHKSAHIGVSIGISLYPEDADSGDQLLAHADAAMYRAKSLGRNTYAFYTQSITRQSQHKQRIYGELKDALEQDQLRLYYQPQVELATGRVTSVEALIRWQHPQQGLLTPNHFIPVAEERGLIHKVTLWVIEAACRQLADWQSQGMEVDIAVNVSPRDFAIDDFYDQVEQLLKQYQVEPKRMHLELTENTLLNQPRQIIETLERFRALGVQLAIDDFGTGYASLAYLRSLPVDKLKIDRSFVNDISAAAHDTTIVRAVIGLSKAFSLTVVAEGVETEIQQDMLRELGCDVGQGYFYNKPLSESDFREWLTQWQQRERG